VSKEEMLKRRSAFSEEKTEDYNELPPWSYITPDRSKSGVILREKGHSNPKQPFWKSRKFSEQLFGSKILVYTITIRFTLLIIHIY